MKEFMKTLFSMLERENKMSFKLYKLKYICEDLLKCMIIAYNNSLNSYNNSNTVNKLTKKQLMEFEDDLKKRKQGIDDLRKELDEIKVVIKSETKMRGWILASGSIPVITMMLLVLMFIKQNKTQSETTLYTIGTISSVMVMPWVLKKTENSFYDFNNKFNEWQKTHKKIR